MKHPLASLLFLGLCPQLLADHWPLNAVDETIKIHGQVNSAAGVSGTSFVLDGSSLIELRGTATLNPPAGFTVSVWFNPYLLEGSQQVIAGKNRYSLDERQWSLTIEPDGKLKAHLRQQGWRVVTCQATLKAGHWHLATLTVEANKAVLYLNGQPVGEVPLQQPLPATQAPITLGGIFDNGRRTQMFSGALDEVLFESAVRSATEIAASYQPVTATHELPKPLLSDTPLWDETQPVPKTADLPVLADLRFSVIKPYEFKKDGYRFLHGVGLCFHKGKLYASFGHNQGAENTDTEEARYCVSEDDGRTWSEVRTMDAGEGPVGVSHGSFLSHKGTLWAFMGAYTGIMQGVHTRAYVLDETTNQWQPKGEVIKDGFWAMQEPILMEDGNWIMAGLKVGDGDPAIVAISHGDDLTKWDTVTIPKPADLKMWGESTVIVKGNHITSISRFGAEARALVAESRDYGRTWTTMLPSNLPMVTSKPIAGLLSTGQRYLVCSTSADGGKRRNPLTIALSRPGETLFSKVFVIRHAVFPEGPGESHERASLSYPYAIEHEGHLYIGYSNSGDKSTRIGEGRELWNNNSAELAVIPIEMLKVE